jgi:hypothetical protein
LLVLAAVVKPHILLIEALAVAVQVVLELQRVCL